MKPGPALRAWDAEQAAADAGDPWGDDQHRWSWCDPTCSDGGVKTERGNPSVIQELRDQCIEAEPAHPRLVKRATKETT